jgi:hypothetical protein
MAIDYPNDPVEGYDIWDSHKDYPLEDWQYQVANNYTRRGYWSWVRSQIELAEFDEEDKEH